LPGAVVELFHVLGSLTSSPTRYGPFIIGGWIYFWLWKHFFRKRAWGSMISTLEHELTHALFGILTFRMIRSLNVTWNQGGHVTFPGRINWLILIAPYWFPTATFVIFIALFLTSASMSPAWSAALGVSVSYHLTSTWIETHAEQSDLRRSGFGFCTCTLPFLNVWAYGVVIALVTGGMSGAGQFSVNVFQRSLNMAQGLIS
ncbi:MAG: hypothetical protein CME01_00050, partial [Geminicoccus sp.]|nr:hypothetical protein [Geminicoccus sp.]